MKAKINVIRWPNGYGLGIETDAENFAFAGKHGGKSGKAAMIFALDASLARELLEKLRRIDDSPAGDADFGVIATSKLANVEIAKQDYCEGNKKHFTFDEAIEIEKKLNNGWRLPTRKEWALICEEFGCDDDGALNSGLLIDNLGLGFNGYYSNSSLNDSGTGGYYWSSSILNSAYGYNLYLGSSGGVGSQLNSYKRYGYSVRLVRDVDREKKNERD